MKLGQLNTLVNTLVVGLAAYFLLKAFRAGQTAIDTATAPVAQAWFDLTRGPGVSVLGRVVLPSGETTTIQSILNAGSSVDSKGFFRWQGTTYQISGRNSAGDYQAVRIIT